VAVGLYHVIMRVYVFIHGSPVAHHLREAAVCRSYDTPGYARVRPFVRPRRSTQWWQTRSAVVSISSVYVVLFMVCGAAPREVQQAKRQRQKLMDIRYFVHYARCLPALSFARQ